MFFGGHFLTVAQEAGYLVEGTELSDDGAARCRSKGFPVYQGQLGELDFGDKKFDIITIWHVLEHVPNPCEVLRKIYSLLKPGGIFVVAVPNEENKLFKRRIRSNKSGHPFGLLSLEGEIHLTHFQPSTLFRFLRSSGFCIEDFGVDDIYAVRSLRNMAVLTMHKALAGLFRWHFSMAMYVICSRPRS